MLDGMMMQTILYLRRLFLHLQLLHQILLHPVLMQTVFQEVHCHLLFHKKRYFHHNHSHQSSGMQRVLHLQMVLGQNSQPAHHVQCRVHAVDHILLVQQQGRFLSQHRLPQ